MKEKVMAALLAVLLVLASGCGAGGFAQGNDAPSGEAGSVTVQPEKFTDEELEAVAREAVSVGLKAKPDKELEQWIDNQKKNPGVWTYRHRDARVIMIAMGEQPTGGYGVLVDEPELKEGTAHINAEFKSPGPNDFTIQVITYPYEIIFVHDDKLNVNLNIIEGSSKKSVLIPAP
ncbi:protease complex subunit PrcB family protein [Desulfofalx alkaliphila]|uniref:protease complex subunit PrcB family protein n=1 Tax=Desulfofalx alkaliphila TaxID=105483 RepID=UPI0004E23A56|nr:protease complex subunit PrcB family protein [Desulfofalx alkaliphila]